MKYLWYDKKNRPGGTLYVGEKKTVLVAYSDVCAAAGRLYAHLHGNRPAHLYLSAAPELRLAGGFSAAGGRRPADGPSADAAGAAAHAVYFRPVFDPGRAEKDPRLAGSALPGAGAAEGRRPELPPAGGAGG